MTLLWSTFNGVYVPSRVSVFVCVAVAVSMGPSGCDVAADNRTPLASALSVDATAPAPWVNLGVQVAETGGPDAVEESARMFMRAYNLTGSVTVATCCATHARDECLCHVLPTATVTSAAWFAPRWCCL